MILDQPDQVATWAATYVKKRILAFAPTPERPFVLGALQKLRGVHHLALPHLTLLVQVCRRAQGRSSRTRRAQGCTVQAPPRFLLSHAPPPRPAQKLTEMHKRGEISFANVVSFK